MPKLQCKVARSPSDPEDVRLSLINKDAKSLSYIDLDATSVERLILALAAVRAKLEPVPPTLDPNPLFLGASIVTEPGVALLDRGVGGGDANDIPLALRHPGIGWLLFRFGATQAAALGEALLRRARPTTDALGEES